MTPAHDVAVVLRDEDVLIVVVARRFETRARLLHARFVAELARERRDRRSVFDVRLADQHHECGFTSGFPCCTSGGFGSFFDSSSIRLPDVSNTALRRNASVVHGGAAPPRYLWNQSRCAV